MHWVTEWPVPSSNSLALNMSDELATTIAIVKAHYFCLSMSTNISCIPSSLEDEELELFDLEVLKLSFIELEPWFQDETMIFKRENPSTWVRSEREKKWVRGVPTYIIPTHKTKHIEAKVMETFFAQGWRLRFGWHSWLRGLIMSRDKD